MTGINKAYIASLLSNVLGVSSPVYLPIVPERNYKVSPYTNVMQKVLQQKYDNAPVRFGKQVFGAFWLKGDTYKEWNHQGQLVDIQVSDYLMPVATIVNFSREKAITKTNTLGLAGTVKEVFGLADWQIDINGLIIADESNPVGQQTVEEQKEKIQQFHELAGSLRVEGQLFAERQISNIVTESLSFATVAGKPNVMQYSISAVSDGDILLTDVND